MPQSELQAIETLREGILSKYALAYNDPRNQPDSRLSYIMEFDTSDGRTSTRGFFNSAPHPQHQPEGDPLVEHGMSDESFTIENFAYGHWIPYHKDRLSDDRTNTLMSMAENGGANHNLIPERGAFDLLYGTTSLIPVTPNAADGTSIFSSSTRFETANGNDLTVSNWNASGAAARGAIWTGLQQFGLYKDGWGQPLHRQNVLEAPVLVLYALQDMDVVAEALHMGTVAQAAATATSNAGVDNVLVQGKLGDRSANFIPWASSRVTAGDMFMCLTGRNVKPFVYQSRDQIESYYADPTNSVEAMKTGNCGVGWRERGGFGAGVVDSILRIQAS